MTAPAAPAAPPADTLLASDSLAEHWVRGAIGLALAVAAFALIGPVGPATLLLLLPAGVAWRGCVSCWALGLAQTRAAVQARSTSGATASSSAL